MKPANYKCCSLNFFFVWRILAFTAASGHFLLNNYLTYNRGHIIPSWQYLTIIGVWLYWLNFVFLLVEHCRSRCKKTEARGILADQNEHQMFLGTCETKQDLVAKSESHHACHMWKLASAWSQMTYSFEIVITLGFWSFAYEAPDEPTTARAICLYMDHSLPFILLTIDFIYHRIYYELNALWIYIWAMLVYGIINIAYTEIAGHPVYPQVKWNSVVSDCVGLSALPIYMLIWLFIVIVSEWKFRVLCMDQAD